MSDTKCYFITWTTYGTWLPGDARDWRSRRGGYQIAKPQLEEWCRMQMRGEAVLLAPHDRKAVENACHDHCDHRGWTLLAVAARTNHVHVIVISNAAPKITRDQLKANCTSALRSQAQPLVVSRTWTRLGAVEILDTDEDIEACFVYVTESQDRKGHDEPRFRKTESKHAVVGPVSRNALASGHEPYALASGDRSGTVRRENG